MSNAEIRKAVIEQFSTIDSDLAELKLTSWKRKLEVMRNLVLEGLDLIEGSSLDESTRNSISTGAILYNSIQKILHNQAQNSWVERASEQTLEDLLNKFYSSIMTGSGFSINARPGVLLFQVNNHKFYQSMLVARSVPKEDVQPSNNNDLWTNRTKVESTQKASGTVFISHSEKDKALVDLLHDLLVRGLGIHTDCVYVTSLDGQGIDAGESVRESIRVALENSMVVICVITPNYKASEPCLNELGAAWALKKRMVGLICEPLEPGRSAFLIDVDSQIKLQNKSRLSALNGFLVGTPGLITSHKPDRWTARLEDFYQKLEEAISKCNFGANSPVQFSNKVTLPNTTSRSGYGDMDYIILLKEYLTRDRKRDHTLDFDLLDAELKIPEGTSKRLIAKAADKSGYVIKLLGEKKVRLHISPPKVYI